MNIETIKLFQETYSKGAYEITLQLNRFPRVLYRKGMNMLSGGPISYGKLWSKIDMTNLIVDLVTDEELYSHFLNSYETAENFIALIVENNKKEALLTIYFASELDGDAALCIKFEDTLIADEYISNLVGVESPKRIHWHN